MTKSIGVLGAGSWGSTLAAMLFEKGYEVTLWEFDQEHAKELAAWRSLKFFPHLVIPKDVTITNDLKNALASKDVILIALPSHTVRATAKRIVETGINLSDTIIVSAAKGIENVTLKRMSEILSDEIPSVGNRIVALSGPTHAEEVSQKMPTTATAASINTKTAAACQEIFSTPFFRIYTSTDIIGVEAGGALKNIFAIAAGISDGIGFGDNTKAALVTRGLREMIALGTRMGGETSTFYGLTGLGDLIVTCFSRHSRNRAVGEKIGRGKSLGDAEKELIMVAEGVKTTRSAYDLGIQFGMELPIINQVYQVLYEGKNARYAVQELMTRELKPEIIQP